MNVIFNKMNLNLYNILKEVLSDNARKKAKEKFKKENPTLSDTQIDYYLDIFSRKQASSVFKQKDIMQYKFSDLEKIIDKEFPKQTYNDKGEVDFKGSEDVLYNENGLLILLGDLKEKCIRYGQGYTWCISRKDQSNMFFSYRMRLNEPVFYFVFDEDRPKEDIWHAIVIYINKSGEYYVATANNPGDKKMSWSEIEEKQPKLKGLQNIFKHIPLTQRERDDYQRFNNPMSDEEYDKLSYDEKEKYIGFGHTLSAEQIEATPKALISKYVTTTVGNNLSKEIEKSLSPSDQKVLRNNRLQNYNNRDDFKFKLIYYPEELTGDDLKVSGDLSLIDTPIKSLPDNLKVSGGLSLADTPIKSLPDNLQVGGNLSLIGTAIESLPDNIQLGGSLFLSRTSIKSLPDNLKVSGSLNLRDTPIKSLPDNLQVGGSIYLNRHLTQKYGKYKIKQSEINNIKEFSNNISLTSILKDILLEAARTPKGKKVPTKYLKGLKSKGEYGSKEAMKKEIDKFAGKKEYKKDWKADFKDGKRIKTKKGAATKAFEKKFGEGVIFENIDIKDGVEEVFKKFSELSEIGTPEQYSKYLDSIFPDSRVKDIVYQIVDGEQDNRKYQWFGDSIEAILSFAEWRERMRIEEILRNKIKKDNPKLSQYEIEDIIDNYFESKKTNPARIKRIERTILNIKNPEIFNSFFGDFDKNVPIHKRKTVFDELEKEHGDGIIIGHKDDNWLDGYPEATGKQFVIFNPKNKHILGSKEDIEGFKKFVGRTESLDENVDKALANKSKKTGVPVSILRQVYNRGSQAWNSGHRPGVTQQQWSLARINSFLTGVGGARKADKDLWEKAKKSKAKKKK